MKRSQSLRRRTVVRSLAALPLLASAGTGAPIPRSIKRPWIGPEYWSNPLQDWQVNNERIECIGAGGDRNVFWLTRSLGDAKASFRMTVKLGRLETAATLSDGFAGFRIGVAGVFDDYRDSAVRGTGLNCGVSSNGKLFIGSPGVEGVGVPLDELQLELEGEPVGENFRLVLRARDAAGKMLAEVARTDIAGGAVEGGVAIVCSSGRVIQTPQRREFPTVPNGGTKPGTARTGNLKFWFRDWAVSGPKVVEHPERAWGPVLWTMYTLSGRVLKLTAQLAPVEAFPAAELQVERNGRWTTITSTRPDPMSCVAAFRVANWDASRDTKYRVRFAGSVSEGTVRRDPFDKPKLTIGALTCQNDHGFPHTPIVRNLVAINPDILFFTGDQIYERNAEYGVQRSPEWAARLDYLRKWFLFGWAWRDLLRTTPTACLPDDHDVYHGNLWGAGGRKAEGTGKPGQDSGGYTMPATWVNMVQRTQCWNLPDPADPAPIEQGISVHFCDLRWGGVSFALLEDRKFKSAPRTVIPDAQIDNGWVQNPQWDTIRQGDAPGAELLGKRQEAFLERWAADWKGGVWMKVAVSATIFNNLATLPPPATTDDVTTGLPIEAVGGFAEGEIKVADHDSNGWPQTARNRAVGLLRKAFAVHIAGDQHLGSTIQYGVEDWNDSVFAICTPAISNLWPRRWFPPQPGARPKPHSPRNTGEFVDGFGNKMTVHAVSNPAQFGVAPEALNNAAPGFGVIELERATRRIRMTNWPRWEDVTKADAKPYAGWPIEIYQVENGSPRGWVLPAIESEIPEPILQVVNQADGQVVYTLRIPGSKFVPKVRQAGVYSVRIFDPERRFERKFANQTAVKELVRD